MKRFFPFILAASLAFNGCSKSDVPGETEKEVEQPKTPLEILIAKLEKAIPEMKEFPTIGISQISEEGHYIVGGINNEKYLFSLFSKENKVVTKYINSLEADAKGKFKKVIVSPVKGYDDLFYFSLSDGNFSTYPGHLILINVVDGKVYPLRDNNAEMEKLVRLNKSYEVISFISAGKLRLYSQKGELLNIISSFNDIVEGGKYVIINKDQLIKASVGGDSKVYLRNLNIHTPFGQTTTNWAKSFSILNWIPKTGETINTDLEISDDRDNAIVTYTATGKKYDAKGDLQDYTEKGTLKVKKKTGELVQ